MGRRCLHRSTHIGLGQAWQTDLSLKFLIEDLVADPTTHEGYSCVHGILGEN